MPDQETPCGINAKVPELVIGLVGGVGTEMEYVVSALTASLSAIGYSSDEVRLSSLLRELPKYSNLPIRYRDQYLHKHMSAGDEFRVLCERDDAVALLGVGKIKILREQGTAPDTGRAYIIRSLKTPEEVKTLRNIYGNSFYLIAAYSPVRDRRHAVARDIARSRNKYPISDHYAEADQLIKRDQEEFGADHGQQSRDSIHRADVFIDMRDRKQVANSVNRFVELLFGNTFHTPSKQEYGMFMAHAAALRSAELGRQVGAAIIDCDGEVVVVGCNEVPKAGGGLYWSDDDPDKREFHNGTDTSDEQKRTMISETLSLLKSAKWLSKKMSRHDDAELLELAIGQSKPALPKESRIRNVIEYGRAVHGEMAALTNAARKGSSVANCTMFVTTFPCHLCARHIVSAGITRVVYVEPYPKSLAPELYLDSISVDGESSDRSHIPFDPFVGVAPRLYQDLFKSGKRKSKDGKVVRFSRGTAQLRYHELPEVYTAQELVELKALTNVMKSKRIIPTVEGEKNGSMAHKTGRRGRSSIRGTARKAKNG